jgi:hypothetical protein
MGDTYFERYTPDELAYFLETLANFLLYKFKIRENGRPTRESETVFTCVFTSNTIPIIGIGDCIKRCVCCYQFIFTVCNQLTQRIIKFGHIDMSMLICACVYLDRIVTMTENFTLTPYNIHQ